MKLTSRGFRQRLASYLEDPDLDTTFHVFMALVMRECHLSTDRNLEGLVHGVETAFSVAADGDYTPQQLREVLEDYALEVYDGGPIGASNYSYTATFDSASAQHPA